MPKLHYYSVCATKVNLSTVDVIGLHQMYMVQKLVNMDIRFSYFWKRVAEVLRVTGGLRYLSLLHHYNFIKSKSK
jgi:hypothetical protein